MNGQKIKDHLDKIARLGVPENIDLWQKISPRVKRRHALMKIQRHPFAAVMLVFLVLLCTSGVVYALGRHLGFIPGVGFVDQTTPLLVLQEPVSIIQDNLQLTIVQVVADKDKTIIIYTIDPQMIPGETEHPSDPDYVAHTLRLPNGQILPGGSGGPDPDRPYDSNGLMQFKLIDPPIPQGVNTFTFIMSNNRGEATVQLIPATDDLILPVTTVAANSTPETTHEPTPYRQTSSVIDKQNLVIENYVEVDDGYILVGYRQRDEHENRKMLPISWENIDICDENGASVEFQDVPQSQDTWTSQSNPYRDYWVIKVLGKNHAWPISISHQPVIELASAEVAEFQIDLGANPETGRTWNLNLDVPLENIGSLHIDSVSLFKGTAPLENQDSYGLDFSVTNKDEQSPFVTFFDKEHQSQFLGGGGGPEGYNVQILYPGGYLPSDKLVLTILYSGLQTDPVLVVDWKP